MEIRGSSRASSVGMVLRGCLAALLCFDVPKPAAPIGISTQRPKTKRAAPVWCGFSKLHMEQEAMGLGAASNGAGGCRGAHPHPTAPKQGILGEKCPKVELSLLALHGPHRFPRLRSRPSSGPSGGAYFDGPPQRKLFSLFPSPAQDFLRLAPASWPACLFASRSQTPDFFVQPLVIFHHRCCIQLTDTTRHRTAWLASRNALLQKSWSCFGQVGISLSAVSSSSSGFQRVSNVGSQMGTLPSLHGEMSRRVVEP